MPTSATIHIQNTAPGPPSMIATETPAILPAPTRPATESISAWNELSWPGWRVNASPKMRNMLPK
ncbi:hypothetical protein D3C77_614160 [compost metagenome]